MVLPQIFSNRQLKTITITIVVFTLVYLIINIFIIGGDFFVFSIDSSVNAPLAIINAITAAFIWRQIDKQRRTLWAGLVAGWALWALAETIWGVYSILGEEVPYPSPADFFWIIGYIPLAIGLLTRMRTMPVKPNRSQTGLIWVVSVTTVIVTAIYIFIPIIQSFDPQYLLESFINLFYPLADIFLVIIVWRLFFTYERGAYGFIWRLLTLGFILMAFSDFVFTYATWQEIYYPDMKATVLSRLFVDVPYTMSYLLWLIGLFSFRTLLLEKPAIKPAVEPERVPPYYGHVLIATKGDDTLINSSPNFSRLFGSEPSKGKSLGEVLGISSQEERNLIEKLRKEGKVADQAIQIQKSSGDMQTVWLSGLAVYNPQNEYSGVNLVLRFPVDDHSFDHELDEYEKSSVIHLLERSGSKYKDEVGNFLKDYYLPHLQVLVDLAVHQGGETMAQALLDELRSLSEKNHWQIEFNLETILDSANHPLEVLRQALPGLLRIAEQFVSGVMDAASVESQMRELESQFSQEVHDDAARYIEPGSEIRFADIA